LRDFKKTSVADRVAIAKRWIKKGYNTNVVLNSIGLAASTYYYIEKKVVKGIKIIRYPQKIRLDVKYQDIL
jgi:hypothetical protein